MIVDGNRITLTISETTLRPTPTNAYECYTFDQFHQKWIDSGEQSIMSLELYRKIKEVFHEGYSEIEIEVKHDSIGPD